MSDTVTTPPSVIAPRAASSQRWWVITSLALIAVGTFVVPLIGWIAGVVMLWISPLFSTVEKLLASIAPPASGLVVFIVLSLVQSAAAAAPGWHLTLLLIPGVPVILALAIGVLLARRAWARTA
ncbi:hypothetical protein [Lacisediminihabitans changchengi]|uniref:Uncharacterized protein n=1 Tax=Lacisediminihabitans changchengi TaxID=2787634 RepID=A0A934W2L3_9MICO|nr:hypothetical protein [Lacisediminihabitans changchengi]MBK4346309.1 hypothetical protein [Lacisediminihabitans changchengi]